MKYLVILCTLFFSLSANAHTIKGKITGLKDGTTIYLLTHPNDTIEHKWVLSHKIDSTIVKMVALNSMCQTPHMGVCGYYVVIKII